MSLLLLFQGGAGTPPSLTKRLLLPEEARFSASAGVPTRVRVAGTAFPVVGLAFSDATVQSAFWRLDVSGYTSGTLIAQVHWYADTASTGATHWGASVAAITPETDTVDAETKTVAVEASGNARHLGTTGQRLHTATVLVTNVDSMAGGDCVWLRVRRLASSSADYLVGDAILERVHVFYPDA